jgi:hypothetical protein
MLLKSLRLEVEKKLASGIKLEQKIQVIIGLEAGV